MSKYSQSFLLARIAVGISLFGHGLVRIPILSSFSGWMIGQFEKSILPHELVTAFSYVLPFAELLIGLFILVGLFSRQSLIAGALLMIILVFGSTTIQQWDAIPSQLIHVSMITVLLAFVDQENTFALDKLLNHRKV